MLRFERLVGQGVSVSVITTYTYIVNGVEMVEYNYKSAMVCV